MLPGTSVAGDLMAGIGARKQKDQRKGRHHRNIKMFFYYFTLYQNLKLESNFSYLVNCNLYFTSVAHSIAFNKKGKNMC